MATGSRGQQDDAAVAPGRHERHAARPMDAAPSTTAIAASRPVEARDVAAEALGVATPPPGAVAGRAPHPGHGAAAGNGAARSGPPPDATASAHANRSARSLALPAARPTARSHRHRLERGGRAGRR